MNLPLFSAFFAFSAVKKVVNGGELAAKNAEIAKNKGKRIQTDPFSVPLCLSGSKKRR
jgi:hypothetical protein